MVQRAVLRPLPHEVRTTRGNTSYGVLGAKPGSAIRSRG
jgi:hypothetical protein